MPKYHVTSQLRKNATRHVLLATPVYGEPAIAYNSSITKATIELLRAGISVTHCVLEGNCHVDDARNDLVSFFLQTENEQPYTDLIFIDADVIFSEDSLLKLMNHSAQIVGGAYPYKDDKDGFPVLLPADGKIIVDKENLVDVIGLPGGFLRIQRIALQKMWSRAAKERGVWRPKTSFYGNRLLAEVFHRKSVPTGVETEHGPAVKRRSGDYQFCADAIEAGFQLKLDPNLTLGHIGEKVYTGNIGRYWMEMTSALSPMMRQASAVIRSFNAKETPSDAETKSVMEALGNLTNAFGNQPFAADPYLLSILLGFATGDDVGTILETGSGISTVIFNLLGKVVTTLESEPVWGGKTERFMTEAGVYPRKPIVYAPIRMISSVGRYYDPPEPLNDLRADLIFIDGPRRTEPGIRGRLIGAAPNLIKNAKYIVIDDTDDDDGRAVAKSVEAFGFDVEFISNPMRREFAVATK